MKVYLVYNKETGFKLYGNKHEAENLACALRCELVHLYSYSLDEADKQVKVIEYDLNIPDFVLKEELEKRHITDKKVVKNE